MTKEDYLQLLVQHDDPVHREVPGGWEKYDYTTAEKRFLNLVKAVEAATGKQCKYEARSCIQDATFIGQILLPDHCYHNAADKVYLRISHFGGFAAYSRDTALKPDSLQSVNEVLQEHGYIYIPTNVLHEPHAEQHPGFAETDWWTRFFDWV